MLSSVKHKEYFNQMSNDEDKPVFKLIKKELDKRSASERKADYYKKRSNKQKDFYANARIATVSIQVLKEALLSSVILDSEGKVLVDWSEALVEELLADIKDPGPRKR